MSAFHSSEIVHDHNAEIIRLAEEAELRMVDDKNPKTADIRSKSALELRKLVQSLKKKK